MCRMMCSLLETMSRGRFVAVDNKKAGRATARGEFARIWCSFLNACHVCALDALTVTRPASGTR